MRLLDTTTKELSEFQNDVPAYAILSHVWEKEEVTFQDIADLDQAKKMQGFAKIVGACNTAAKDGLRYIWIDTCCINKDSSAEVSEAINSMYVWYKNSRVCYAYLSDVPSEGDHENPCSFFATSLWFSRGWTLQELISPRRVVFYGVDWVDIGTKATLRHTISTITGIDVGIILDGSLDRLNNVPIAVRMSWAADRNTTREEDVAYSLMGLFGVSMPLLYGEGRKAFIRLQHEIIKQSDDHSIFAWASQDDSERGILARSPSEFRNSDNIERIPDSSEDTKPYFITNRGLRIDLPTLVKSQSFFERVVLVLLNCRFVGEPEAIAIELSCFSPQGKLIRPQQATLTYTRTRTAQLQNGVRREAGVFKEWMRQSRHLVPSESLYIMDDYFKSTDSIAKLPHEILVKVRAPAEYGKLQLIDSQLANNLKEMSESEWKYIGDREGILAFERPSGHGRFSVMVGKWEGQAVYCDVRAGLVGESERSEPQFLDRASADLADGWSVTVYSGTSDFTSTTGDQFASHVEVEIKKSPIQRNHIPTLMRPDGKVGCLVVPPAPRHGFMVTDRNVQSAVEANWIQHLGCFLLYMDRQTPQATGVLTFTSDNSEDEFSLLVGSREGGGILSGIEQKKLDTNTRHALVHNQDHCKVAYSVALDHGKTVSVTIRECRDTSIADFMINVSTR